MGKYYNMYLFLSFGFFPYVISNTKSAEENRKGDTGQVYTKHRESDDVNNVESDNKTSIEDLSKQLMCKYYKNGENLDLVKMSDVWQTVYYQLPEDIMCFKIHIRRTTVKERKEYENKYGSFGNTVNWNKCLMEVKGAIVEDHGRRHFLMGDVNNTGVFENVIIWEREGQTFPNHEEVTYIRGTESPDQWRVIRDLLLLRDCNEGHIVVFSRFPRQHLRVDIYDALMEFGEYTMDGKMTCSQKERH